MVSRRVFTVLALVFFVFFGFAWPAEELPIQLSDEAFWKLITDFSEPSGSFISDNFVSNERTFQRVLTDLADGRKGQGAYLGVGPEQNFTYIVALKPKIAFIVDIRRQNMVQHLMYKAVAELSTDRAEFLSRLFSRPKPADLDKNSTVTALFDGFRGSIPDPKLYEDNLQSITDRLEKTHGFNLTSEDEVALKKIYTMFYNIGPGLTYNGPRTSPVMPTYEEVMSETDLQGVQRSFLATEENFLALRDLEKNNLLVPLVGDFAGPKALRSVGQYLKERNASVTAFYTSNVEQYLFLNGSDAWRAFYANVASLPLTTHSVFIRFNTDLGPFPNPTMSTSSRPVTLLCSLPSLVGAFDAGVIAGYTDVFQACNQ
jgi:hypothetical protein